MLHWRRGNHKERKGMKGKRRGKKKNKDFSERNIVTKRGKDNLDVTNLRKYTCLLVEIVVDILVTFLLDKGVIICPWTYSYSRWESHIEWIPTTDMKNCDVFFTCVIGWYSSPGIKLAFSKKRLVLHGSPITISSY